MPRAADRVSAPVSIKSARAGDWLSVSVTVLSRIAPVVEVRLTDLPASMRSSLISPTVLTVTARPAFSKF